MRTGLVLPLFLLGVAGHGAMASAQSAGKFTATATLLNSGKVLIAGGSVGVATAELYRPEVLIPAPLLFSVSGDGRGPGAILHGPPQQ